MSQALAELTQALCAPLVQRCTQCGTTKTGQWRNRGPGLLCNACGIRAGRLKRKLQQGGGGASKQTAAATLPPSTPRPMKCNSITCPHAHSQPEQPGAFPAELGCSAQAAGAGAALQCVSASSLHQADSALVGPALIGTVPTSHHAPSPTPSLDPLLGVPFELDFDLHFELEELLADLLPSGQDPALGSAGRRNRGASTMQPGSGSSNVMAPQVAKDPVRAHTQAASAEKVSPIRHHPSGMLGGFATLTPVMSNFKLTYRCMYLLPWVQSARLSFQDCAALNKLNTYACIKDSPEGWDGFLSTHSFHDLYVCRRNR